MVRKNLAPACGYLEIQQFCRDKCQRADCLLFIQMDGKPSQCEKNNVGNQGQCAQCFGRTVYIGETTKTGVNQHSTNN